MRVNGVLLGAEPTPLMHGDKVEVAGLELRFADESKRGATQYMSVEAIPPRRGREAHGRGARDARRRAAGSSRWWTARNTRCRRRGS